MHIQRTLVIGAGGTGGHLTPPLARMLSYHPSASCQDILVADGDAFEAGNIARQHIGNDQLGRNKAKWMADLCHQMGLPSVTAVPEYLSASNLRPLIRISGFLLVVAAVDNDATRKLVIDELQLLRNDGFLFITPGNSGAEDPDLAIKGNVLWFGRQGDQPIGLNPALVFPNIEHPQDAVPRTGSCALAEPSSPQLIAANALAAAYTLTVVQNLLDGVMTPDSNAVFFNGRSFSTTCS